MDVEMNVWSLKAGQNKIQNNSRGITGLPVALSHG